MGTMRLSFGVLIGLGFLCTSAQAQSTTLAIRGTWIVDVTDGSLHPDQTVLIRGNRIVAIGPATTIAVPDGTEIVEAAGGYLIPGLWDMHVHASRSGRAPRFWPLFAAHGVTGVRDMGSFVDSLLYWRAESRRPASLAPRTHWSVPALGRWGDAHALPEPDAETTAALVDSWKRHEFDFIKVGSELSRELYFALIERSRQQGIPVIGHIPRSVTAIEASDAGQKSVEHVTELIIPCTAGASALGLALADAAARYGAASDSARAAEQRLAGALAFGEPDPAECGPLLERMAANETWLTPTLTLFKGETQPSSFDGDPRLRWVPASVAERWRTGRRLTPELEAQVGGRIMANALKAVTIAYRAGVGILAGTDAGDDAYIFAGSGLHDELALLVEAGLTPLAALQAATLNPARFLGRTDDLGTVTTGKLADLVLLEANPLADIANTRRIRAVIADGRLYRAADLERLIADVERAVAAAMPNGTPVDKIATHDSQIATHDNVRPAGRLQDGGLSLSLWAGAGDWYPEGERSTPRRVAALGEEGGPLSIPSPLIRVPEGTVVHVVIRNTFSTPLRVHGLCDRTDACEAVTVPAGETTNVRFALRDAGTFHYWATTADRSLTMREDDSQLGGAIVVDPPGADVLDRVFVLGMLEEESGGSITEFTVINGRSWPHTERLEYGVGDTVRWRLANLTAAPHALHLHGFYFHVESVGDGARDTHYSGTDRRLAVTEQVMPGGTTTLSWIPERAGNWLFHCHMLVHMHPVQHGAAAKQHVSDETAAGMAGLVLGVHVTGSHQAVAIPDAARRPLRLIIEPDTRSVATASYRVDLVAGADPPPRVSERAVPGPVMVLTRGEPVAVEVLNRLSEPTAIHWHGIELESYDDGVAGFSGTPGSVTPPVAAGGTFTARFTPSRAGTFMYHAHWHDPDQLAGGIYGPLIVLEPGQTWDPVSDHIIVLGLDGPYRPAPDEDVVVNGEAKPRPLELKAGVTHRLRFINITADNVALTVQLLSGFDPVRWTLVGKDGADAPPAQRTERPARQLVAVGETYDFELAPMSPRAVGLWLELRRGTGELLIQWPVRVR